MANRIKGITVEIGGDTTGLDKALKSVNSSIMKTQSALNDVNRLLKLDPSNTVLVAQKQELLAQAVSQTEEKLSALEAAQEQVVASFGRKYLYHCDPRQKAGRKYSRIGTETKAESRRLLPGFHGQ